MLEAIEQSKNYTKPFPSQRSRNENRDYETRKIDQGNDNGRKRIC